MRRTVPAPRAPLPADNDTGPGLVLLVVAAVVTIVGALVCAIAGVTGLVQDEVCGAACDQPYTPPPPGEPFYPSDPWPSP